MTFLLVFSSIIFSGNFYFCPVLGMNTLLRMFVLTHFLPFPRMYEKSLPHTKLTIKYDFP